MSGHLSESHCSWHHASRGRRSGQVLTKAPVYAGDVPGCPGGEQRLHDRALAALRAGVRPALRQHAAHLAQRALQPLSLLTRLGRLPPRALSLPPAASEPEGVVTHLANPRFCCSMLRTCLASWLASPASRLALSASCLQHRPNRHCHASHTHEGLLQHFERFALTPHLVFYNHNLHIRHRGADDCWLSWLRLEYLRLCAISLHPA